MFCQHCQQPILSKNAKKFCSQSCSASFTNSLRSLSDSTKNKISKKVADYYLNNPKPKKIKQKPTKKFIKYHTINKKFIKTAELIIGYEPQNDSDIDDFYSLIKSLYFIDNLSPQQINDRYSLGYKNFASFIKSTMKIDLKTISQSINNFYIQTGQSISDDKIIYKNKCKFKFDPYQYPNLPGYDLLIKYGMFHSTNNPSGVCRDHMYSKEAGYNNNIDPKLLAHPANCHFMFNSDNAIKNTSCSISIEELLKRIDDFNHNKPISFKNSSTHKQQPKSNTHKQKLSNANKGKRGYTNGMINKWVNPNETPPLNFWPGITRK